MSAKNIIELNGKRYDAATGKLLGSESHTSARPSRAIDDFVRHPKPSPPSVAKPTPKPPKPVIRPKPKPVAAHRPERAKTLMRSSVKKPQPNSKPKPKVQTLAGNMPPRPTLHPTASSKPSSSGHRLARANHIARSQLVSRFTSSTPTLAKKIQSLDIKMLPKSQHLEQVVSSKPVVAISSAKSRANDLLMAGLARADSHLQPPVISTKQRHKLRKMMRYSGIVLTCLIIAAAAGLLIYRSVPSLQVHYASARAGVHAELPTYEPAGFTFASPVIYQKGLVVINFHAATSGKEFGLSEQSSSWDSDTLRDNFVIPLGVPYQTTEAGGRLIYTYGNGSATWVNAGIWYQLAGSANLTSNQLVSIATSL